ncbi:MAG: hypothetical protein A2669_02670 [Candidatus Yanofskybacteria bacterium RIFCSPHIGHO2_01_FULL_48_25b]|uniref:Glycosyltransferase RgtA/B/C/D-like domain-containing protein n=1 Tax=Candidatus Yanofskybacteria bacterium RIFCSPHIGHO2_01_FULL_48_25b TaxID=1802672 RepID=A0A1F8F1F7_9BACT|nr:MAG: hypothetical protein A2669_02670 [Candidatus Yanofskybacteria bacterium RIFCSPHIGHO2_01_FULL_48_25b]
MPYAMRFIKQYKFEFGVVLLALVVRLALFSLSFDAAGGNLDQTVSGADGYYTISQNLLAGNGYSSSGEAPYTLNSIRPPVQPYFLAGMHTLFGGYGGPLALQILIGSLIPLLGMRLARYITRSRGIALTVGVVLALEPLSALFSFIFYAETTGTFLFLLSLLCFFEYFEGQRLKYLLYAAVMLGLATLTKPTFEFVPLLCAAALLWHYRAKWRAELPRVAFYLAVFVLTLSPWLIRNYQEFGVVALSPQLGEQLYVVLVPSVLSMHNGTSFATEFKNILAQGGVDPNQATVAQSTEFLHRAIPILLAHPKALALTLGNTALNFYIHDGVFEVLKHVGLKPTVLLGKPALFLLFSDPGKLIAYTRDVMFQPTIFILFARVFWIAITVLFFLGAVRYLRTEKDVRGILAIGVVLYFMLTTLVIGLAVTGRYRIPVEAIIITFAAYAAAPGISKIRSQYDV